MFKELLMSLSQRLSGGDYESKGLGYRCNSCFTCDTYFW